MNKNVYGGQILSDELISYVRKEYANGVRIADICKKTNITRWFVTKIIENQSKEKFQEEIIIEI